MNSNSLLTTVFKNFQCARKKRGYCPTTYMILLATTALLSLPLFCSQRPNKSLMTVTKNLFSSSSDIAPEILPMAQHSVFNIFQSNCDSILTWSESFESIMDSVSSQWRWVK